QETVEAAVATKPSRHAGGGLFRGGRVRSWLSVGPKQGRPPPTCDHRRSEGGAHAPGSDHHRAELREAVTVGLHRRHDFTPKRAEGRIRTPTTNVHRPLVRSETMENLCAAGGRCSDLCGPNPQPPTSPSLGDRPRDSQATEWDGEPSDQFWENQFHLFGEASLCEFPHGLLRPV